MVILVMLSIRQGHILSRYLEGRYINVQLRYGEIASTSLPNINLLDLAKGTALLSCCYVNRCC